MAYHRDKLILNNSLLRVLEHFRLAKVDYAKNVTKYTEIQRDTVLSYIQELESYGFLEKYTNTSIKRTSAKLKKSAEVHKHHTYYEITRGGIIALNEISPKSYLQYLASECISLLLGKKENLILGDKSSKLVEMGLLKRNFDLTSLGRTVLNELKH